MQEFPVHRARDREFHLELDKKRDRLGAENRPYRIQSAFQMLYIQCVTETLRLTGVPVAREEVTRVVRGDMTNSVNRELIRGQMSALEAVASSAHDGRGLDRSLVLQIHRLSCPPAGGTFRRGPVRRPLRGQKPSRAELIVDQVDNLVQWLEAESASKMHATEKAALTFTRLLEISPFEVGNFRTAHLLLSYFALSEGYPPFCLRFDDASEIRGDILRAMCLDTESLVLRLSEALARSLDFCMDAVRGSFLLNEVEMNEAAVPDQTG